MKRTITTLSARDPGTRRFRHRCATYRGAGLRLRRAVGTLFLAATIAALAVARAPAQDEIYSAERVKAAFLYHFSTYVNWPESAMLDDKFTIAVFGAEEIAAELEQFLPGHTIQGRPMDVKKLRSIADLTDDEVLFIGADHNRRLDDYLEAVASKPLLVVTDTPDGLRDGAMINFRIVDDRVRFEISLRAAQGAGLEMSSRLLSAAMSVESAGAIIDLNDTVVVNDHYGNKPLNRVLAGGLQYADYAVMLAQATLSLGNGIMGTGPLISQVRAGTKTDSGNEGARPPEPVTKNVTRDTIAAGSIWDDP